MKILLKLAIIFSFILPYSFVSADTHDDATMDVIEHSSSEHFEHEIELPHADDDDHEKGHHDSKDDDDHDEKDDAKDDDKEDSHDEKEDSHEESQEDDDKQSSQG